MTINAVIGFAYLVFLSTNKLRVIGYDYFRVITSNFPAITLRLTVINENSNPLTSLLRTQVSKRRLALTGTCSSQSAQKI